jgi:hypothetical protein
MAHTPLRNSDPATVSGILRDEDSPSRGHKVKFNDQVNIRVFKQSTPGPGSGQDMIMVDSPEVKKRDPTKFLVEMPEVLPHIILPRDERPGKEYPEMMYAQHPVVESAKPENKQSVPFLNRVEAMRSWANTLPIPPTPETLTLPWNMGPAPYLPFIKYHWPDIEVTLSTHVPNFSSRTIAWKLLGDFCEAYGFILNVAAGAEGESPWDWIEDFLPKDWQAIAWDYMGEASGHKARIAFLDTESEYEINTDSEEDDDDDEEGDPAGDGEEKHENENEATDPDGRPMHRKASNISGREGRPREGDSEYEQSAGSDNDSDTPTPRPKSVSLRVKRATSGPLPTAKRPKTR